jgi:UDP-N-acetylmuramyl pentapeptide phosphotransferase/UDP-N-acetylglucosamine-1-phosphate transferase
MAAAPELAKQPLFPSLDSIEAALWPGAVLLAFVVTAVLVDLMVIISTRFRLVDLPNRRSAHSLPTARGGGVAIVLVICLAAIATVFRWPSLAGRVLIGVILPGLVIAVVGILDDIRPLRPSLRLVIQIAVAFGMIAMLRPLAGVAIPNGITVEFGIFAWPITLLWIVGMINAYNFIDGADGMAGLGAVVVGGAMAMLGYESRSLAAMLLAAFAAAAAGGFLVFNWHPARVFMGDVGSGFLGLFFAAIPLIFREPRQDTFLPVVLALWPYVFDTLLSVLRRVWHGQNPFVPHREFLFHRLIRSGASHSSAAMLYGLLSAIGGLLGLLMVAPDVPPAVKAWVPAMIVLLAAFLTYTIERRCRHAGLPSAATRYSSALH